MALLSLYSSKGVRHCFKRLTFLFCFLFFTSGSNAAHVILADASHDYLNEYIASECLVDNTVDLRKCYPNQFTRTFISAYQDLIEMSYIKRDFLSFCYLYNCDWAYSSERGAWSVPTKIWYDIVHTNHTTGAVTHSEAQFNPTLYNFGCAVNNDMINCTTACSNETECYAHTSAACGANSLVRNWRYEHNNDYGGDCYQDPIDDVNSDPDLSIHRLDPLMGPRGYSGRDGKDGKDGDSCSVRENNQYVRIECQGTAATVRQGRDGATGEKGDTGDKGDKGDQGDSCTTHQTSSIAVHIICGQTQTTLNAPDPINPPPTDGGGGTDDGNLDPEILTELTKANTKTDSIIASLGSMNGQIGGLTGHAAATSAKLDGVQSQLGSMQSLLGATQGAVEGVGGRLDGLMGINSGLAGQIGGLTGAVNQGNSQNQQAMFGIQNSLRNIERRLDDSSNYDDAGYYFNDPEGAGDLVNELGDATLENTESDFTSIISDSKYLNGAGLSFSNSNECPPPQEITILGNVVSFSWQPMCQMSDVIHSIVILASWFLVYKLFIRNI